MNEKEIIIREFRTDDFDAVTILWRIAREKSLPEFQQEKGYFFFEDQNYFRDHILKKNKVWIVEVELVSGGFYGNGERIY